MHPWLRRLFVWLVALALPVQGLAGVARLHCAAAPERTVAVVAAAGHDHAAHRAGHAHADPGAAHHAAVDDDASQAADSAPAHKCSACAACTVGAALPPARTVMPQPEPEGPAARAAPLPALSFIASGPERPPRSRHA